MSASLFSSPVQVRAHTQHLALSHRRWSLKAFILSFFVLQWVFIFGGFQWKKRKVILGRVFALSPTFLSVEGLFIFPEAISAASVPGPIPSLIFFKTLIILRGPIPGPIMPSNSQYLQSFFV